MTARRQSYRAVSAHRGRPAAARSPALRALRALLASLALLALPAALAPGAAWAEPHSGVDSNLFRQAVDGSGLFSIDGAESLERYDLAVKLGMGYGYRPLRLAVPGIADGGSDAVLSYALGVHVTIGFALFDRLTLVLDTGLYRTATGDGYGDRGRYDPVQPEPSTGLISLRPLSNIDPSGGFEPQGASGPLDARVGFKVHVLDRDRLDVAVLALARLPFGEDEMFLGDASYVFSPEVAVEYALDAVRRRRVLVNLGAHIRQRTVLQAYDYNTEAMADARAVLDVGSELFLGGGYSHTLRSRIDLAAEAMLLVPLPGAASYGDCRLADGRPCAALDDDMYFQGAGQGDFAGYLLVGGRYRLSAETTLGVAVGTSPLGSRGELVRGQIGVTWTPLPQGAQAIGGGDIDGDDIPDVADVCPDEAEDVDGYQDSDGCPELDNDGDGLEDSVDSCPDDPEDKDGHLDEDGCPELDNDNDNIADIADRCIDEAEDYDGFEDEDGCPESDNDGDGIPDDKDRCPNQPETVNGIDDEDGCPDARTATGPIEQVDRIDLRGNTITFAGSRSARLTRGSEALLEQVAAIIKQRNVRIRIEVHVPLSTRSQSRRALARAQAADKRLAQRRADAILGYLVRRQGVPLPLLQAVGIGSARPLEEPATSGVNERVDFIKSEQRQP